MLLSHLFRILVARAGTVLLIFLITLGTAIGVSLLLTKKYTATTTVVSELRSTDPVLGGAVGSPVTIQSYLSTQVEVIRSERVAAKVIDQLKLETHPVMQSIIGADQQPVSAATVRARIHDHFLRKLDVQSSREGAAISMTYESTDPDFAAKVVNAFADAYVQTNMELRTGPAKDFREWFENQTRLYREQLSAAQSKLSAAQRESGILVTDERYDVENSRLTELSQQLTLAQAAAVDSRSRADAAVKSGSESMTEVVASPLLQALKTDVSRAESRLQQLAVRLGPAHPEYASAAAELAQLKQRLDSETAKVASSIGTSSAVNQQRESQLRAAVEAQRVRVQQMRASRDRLAVLEREVQSAQRALDLVSQRLTETNLESQSRASNISILTRATPATEPSRPKPLLNTIIGGVLGLLIGVLAALALESTQKPVRTADDLLHAAGVPVLAVLPPAGTKRHQRLIGSTGPSGSASMLQLGNSQP